MKQAFEYFIEAVMVTIIIAIIVGAMNITSQIREANEFHNLAIAEVEASDFDDSIIKKYATGEVNPNVITEFKNASVTTDSSVDYASERIYKVTTTYQITLPILGYVKTTTISGYAR